MAENRAGAGACGNVSYIVDDDDDDDDDDDNDDADGADDDDDENPGQLSSGKPEAMFPTLLTCFSACQEEFDLLRRRVDPLLSKP